MSRSEELKSFLGVQRRQFEDERVPLSSVNLTIVLHDTCHRVGAINSIALLVSRLRARSMSFMGRTAIIFETCPDERVAPAPADATLEPSAVTTTHTMVRKRFEEGSHCFLSVRYLSTKDGILTCVILKFRERHIGDDGTISTLISRRGVSLS